MQVWHLGASTPNFTLQGHEKGVNCLDYFQGGEKPYLVSGADDRLVKIWDYQNKTCVQVRYIWNIMPQPFRSPAPSSHLNPPPPRPWMDTRTM